MDYDIKIVGDGCYNEVKNCQVFPHLDYNAFQQLMYNASLVVADRALIFFQSCLICAGQRYFYEAGNPEMIDLEYQLIGNRHFHFHKSTNEVPTDVLRSMLRDEISAVNKHSFMGATQVARHLIEEIT